MSAIYTRDTSAEDFRVTYPVEFAMGQDVGAGLAANADPWSLAVADLPADRELYRRAFLDEGFNDLANPLIIGGLRMHLYALQTGVEVGIVDGLNRREEMEATV